MYEQWAAGSETPSSHRIHRGQPAAGAPARRAERAGAAEPLPSHAPLQAGHRSVSAPVPRAATHRPGARVAGGPRAVDRRRRACGGISELQSLLGDVSARHRHEPERVPDRRPRACQARGVGGDAMRRLDVAVLGGLARLVALLSVAALLVAPVSAAEPDTAGSLTVEGATSRDGQGHPTLQGYINNLYDVPVDTVTIRIAVIDAASQTQA